MYNPRRTGSWYRKTERLLSARAMVFQLPVIDFPEAGVLKTSFCSSPSFRDWSPVRLSEDGSSFLRCDGKNIRIGRGCSWVRITFFWGFFKKLVIADRMAAFAETRVRCRLVRVRFASMPGERIGSQSFLWSCYGLDREGIAATVLKQMR